MSKQSESCYGVFLEDPEPDKKKLNVAALEE